MDSISRIYCEELKLRAYTVTSLDVTREVTSLHKTTPNATVALGRTINAAALLGATLKPQTNQSLLLKFSGSGPLREVHVQVDAFGSIRGYVANPMVDVDGNLNRISFSDAIGAGLLTVIKDTGINEPYSSVTPLMNGEVAADLAYYLASSEQVPSAVIIGLNIDRNGGITSSGGILIQTFPDTETRVIDEIEARIQKMERHLGDRLQHDENIISIVGEIFGGNRTEILSTTPLVHRCRCSHETLFGILKTVHSDELRDMIEKDGGASITCTFCTKEYQFTKGELLSLIK